MSNNHINQRIINKMESIIEIKHICGKQAGPRIARFYRETSYYLTWFLLHFNLTANQVSILGVIFGLFSTLFFITNNYYLFMIGSLIFFVSVIADYSDGEVARYRKYKKLPDEPFREHGGFFDSLNHIPPPMLLFMMSLSFIDIYPPVFILGIGVISALFRLLNIGFYSWMESVLKLMRIKTKNKTKNYKVSRTVKSLRYVYSSLYIPFSILVFSILSIILNKNMVFYLWIFYAVWGALTFIISSIQRRQSHYA